MQKKQHYDRERKICYPSPGDAAGDAVSPGPAAHRENEASHPWVQLSVKVQQLCALHRHPVEKTQDTQELLTVCCMS